MTMFSAVLIIGVLIYLIIVRRNLYELLLISFFSRVLLSIIHIYFYRIPSVKDDITFEEVAFNWSIIMGNNSKYIIDLFDPTQSYVISWIGAVIYLVVGRDFFLLTVINIFLSIVSVVLLYDIVLKISNSRSKAFLSALILSIHPTIIENSAVFLREPFVVLFLLLSINALLNWHKSRKDFQLVLSIFFLTLSSFFHGAMIFGITIILFVYLFQTISQSKNRVLSGLIPLNLIIALILIISTPFLFSLFIESNTKLQILFGSSGLEPNLLDVFNYLGQIKSEGDSAYLIGLKAESLIDLITFIPIKIVYFLFSPFPWDVSKITHLKGFIDSIFILVSVIMIFKNRKIIFSSRLLTTLLIMLIFYILIFAIGTSNFGTAIRHKAKLIPLFIILMNCPPKQFLSKVAIKVETY